MIISYGVCAIILAIGILGIFFIEKDRIERKRNPIPRMDNFDKRFIDIKNEAVQEIFKIVRGD